jgi:hypothetical protein
MTSLRKAIKAKRPTLENRLSLFMSTGSRVDGLWIGSFAEDAEACRRRVEEALLLIKTYDHVRYGRLIRDLERVWVNLILGGIAQFDASIWACTLDPRHVLDETIPPEIIAASIVHEATHARLWRRGFGYEEELRSRVEAICFRRERAFAAKLPNGEQVREQADRCLAAYNDRDHWTNEAFRKRYDVQIEKAAVYAGVPNWLIRILKRLRAWRLRLKGTHGEQTASK